MKKLFQKLLSPKQSEDDKHQPTQPQTSSPYGLRAIPPASKKEAPTKEKNDKVERKNNRCQFVKDVNADPSDAIADLTFVLKDAMKFRSMCSSSNIEIPTDIHRKIVITLLDSDPTLFEICALVCREWRAAAFTFFESKRTTNALNPLETTCYLSLLLDSRFSSKPSPLIDSLRSGSEHLAFSYFTTKRLSHKHSWDLEYEGIKRRETHLYKSVQQGKVSLTVLPLNSQPKNSIKGKYSVDKTIPYNAIISVKEDLQIEGPKYMMIMDTFSECTITTNVWKKPYELTMTFIQYYILSMFESRESIEIESLPKQLKIHESQLEGPLYSLIAIGILNYHDLHISLNPNFESDESVINCCTLSPIRFHEPKLGKPASTVPGDDKLLIQAFLVRTMKQKRSAKLIELIDQAFNYFNKKYSKKSILKLVDILREKEYLELKEGVISYVP